MVLTFSKKTELGTDDMGNALMVVVDIEVADCLVAPITEPITAREQQAMEQSRDQIRIHLPKEYTGDVSNSEITYDGKVFCLDSDGVKFMDDNTPTRWNRYIRAESVNG